MRNIIKKILKEGYWEELYKSKRYVQKFDVGERVVMNGTVGGKSITNELGTVLKYKHTGGGTGHPHRVYLIKFDSWNDKERNFLMSPVQADQNREFIDSRCSDGSCWYSTSDNLEPAPNTDNVFDQLNESEDDFDWVDLPESPKDNSYAEKVRYALENTEFKLVYYTLFEGDLVQIKVRGDNPSTLLSGMLKDFTPEYVKKQSDRNILVLYKHKIDSRYPEELEDLLTLHMDLAQILKQID